MPHFISHPSLPSVPGHPNPRPKINRHNFRATSAGRLEHLEPRVLLSDTPTVIGRYLFYNNSGFDGYDLAVNDADDAAIDATKQALLTGQTATFANYSSYARGLNGIMLDIAGLTNTLTQSDFVFTVGNDQSPASWSPAPTPTAILMRPLPGINHSTRVEITFNDNAIQNQWLRITLKGGQGSNSGLAHNDVFYFGNAIGESGDSPSSARVDVLDALAARAAATPNALVSNPCDFNRDGLVNTDDQSVALTHVTYFLNELRLFAAPPTETLAARELFDEGTLTNVGALSPGNPGSFTSVSGAIRSTLVGAHAPGNTPGWSGLIDANGQYGTFDPGGWKNFCLEAIFRPNKMPKQQLGGAFQGGKFSSCFLMFTQNSNNGRWGAVVTLEETGNVQLNNRETGLVMQPNHEYMLFLYATNVDNWGVNFDFGWATAAGQPITWSATHLSYVVMMQPLNDCRVGCINAFDNYAYYQCPWAGTLQAAALYTGQNSRADVQVPADLVWADDSQRTWHWSINGNDNNAGDDASRPLRTAAIVDELWNAGAIRGRTGDGAGDIVMVDDGGASGIVMDSFLRMGSDNCTLMPETGRSSISLWGFKPVTSWTQVAGHVWESTSDIRSDARMFENAAGVRTPMVNVDSSNTRAQAIALLNAATADSYWVANGDVLIRTAGDPAVTGITCEKTQYFGAPDGTECLLELIAHGGTIDNLTAGGTALTGPPQYNYVISGAGSGDWVLNNVNTIFGGFHDFGIVWGQPNCNVTLNGGSAEQCVNSSVPLVFYSPQGIGGYAQLSGGAGYAGDVTVTISKPANPNGIAARAKAYVNNLTGAIDCLVPIAPGYGYAQGEIPTITISGSGTGASFSAVPISGINATVNNFTIQAGYAVEGSPYGTAGIVLCHGDGFGVNLHTFDAITFNQCNLGFNGIGFNDDNTGAIYVIGGTNGGISVANPAVLHILPAPAASNPLPTPAPVTTPLLSVPTPALSLSTASTTLPSLPSATISPSTMLRVSVRSPLHPAHRAPASLHIASLVAPHAPRRISPLCILPSLETLT